MQSTTIKRTSGPARGCGHCRNLQKSDWTGHIAKLCPELAKTKCSHCKNYGHTTRYCVLWQDKEVMKIMNTPEMQDSIEKAIGNMIIIGGGAALAQASAPVGNSWANAAKKAVTSDDKSIAYAFEEKVKVDLAEKKKKEQEAYLEKKRKEHEAYLERKERRETLAKEKKANLELY